MQERKMNNLSEMEKKFIRDNACSMTYQQIVDILNGIRGNTDLNLVALRKFCSRHGIRKNFKKAAKSGENFAGQNI